MVVKISVGEVKLQQTMSSAQQRGRNGESRESLAKRAQEVEGLSNALLTVGATIIRQKPGWVGLYVLGLLLCLLFTGFEPSEANAAEYQSVIADLDVDGLQVAQEAYTSSYGQYQEHKGWFTCNGVCQIYKSQMLEDKAHLEMVNKEYQRTLSEAKSKIGVFSTQSVEETRALFWEKFGQGRQAAKRSTMWDIIFMNFSRMRKDEKLMTYLMRILISFVTNVTIGLIMAAVTFVFAVYYVVISYQADLFSGLAFFGLASLAGVSFILTWLLVFYFATAGTVYVGAKTLASNLRLQGENSPRYVSSSR